MNIRNIIAENALAVFLKMLPDNIKTAWQFAKNNARCNNSKSESKSLTDILMLIGQDRKIYCEIRME